MLKPLFSFFSICFTFSFLLSMSVAGPAVAAEAEAEAEAEAQAQAQAQTQAQADQPPVVRLETTLGNIDIELYPDRAPETVANFLDLVDNGFYDGLIFHRVVAGFVIQAGGYDGKLTYRTPPRTVVNESTNGLRNQKYSVAMARLSDPDSADSQFFINVRHNPSLDGDRTKPGYTVFGQVIAGMDVVTTIELVDTHLEAGMAGVPEEDVFITRAARR